MTPTGYNYCLNSFNGTIYERLDLITAKFSIASLLVHIGVDTWHITLTHWWSECHYLA